MIAHADIIDNMEKALMPGQLTKAHEEFEEDCEACHEFFQQSLQNDKCLDCHDHKNVKLDIKNKKGFHGRIPGVMEKDCKVCHREHIGRDADIMLLDIQTFNHDETDFVLRASHLEVQCQACHKPKKKFHEAKHKCAECHKDNEPHKGKLGKVCDSCHRESSWNDFQFDHSKTDFE
ncbi:cytochrome c3 family protein, partial [Kaarinaea lacus]